MCLLTGRFLICTYFIFSFIAACGDEIFEVRFEYCCNSNQNMYVYLLVIKMYEDVIFI